MEGQRNQPLAMFGVLTNYSQRVRTGAPDYQTVIGSYFTFKLKSSKHKNRVNLLFSYVPFNNNINHYAL
jgi:hypothetical protein